jgi:hypothetical protein
MIYRAKTGAGDHSGFFFPSVVLLNGSENSLKRNQLKAFSIGMLHAIDIQKLTEETPTIFDHII